MRKSEHGAVARTADRGIHDLPEPRSANPWLWPWKRSFTERSATRSFSSCSNCFALRKAARDRRAGRGSSLHPNTVRGHLAVLEEAELVASSRERRSVRDARDGSSTPHRSPRREHELLAEALAATLSEVPDGPRCGRLRPVGAATRRAGATRPSARGSFDRGREAAPRGTRIRSDRRRQDDLDAQLPVRRAGGPARTCVCAASWLASTARWRSSTQACAWSA